VVLLPSAGVLAAASLQAVLARRCDLTPLTVWSGAMALFAGMPDGAQWVLWGLAAACVAVGFQRRRRVGPGRAGLLAVVVGLGLGLHGAVALLPAVPMLAWACVAAFLGVVWLGMCLEPGHDRRQVRWVGEIPIREPQRPTTNK
jgi:hypothetical protein